jgi:hypothetical protein
MEDTTALRSLLLFLRLDRGRLGEEWCRLGLPTFISSFGLSGERSMRSAIRGVTPSSSGFRVMKSTPFTCAHRPGNVLIGELIEIIGQSDDIMIPTVARLLVIIVLLPHGINQSCSDWACDGHGTGNNRSVSVFFRRCYRRAMLPRLPR